MSSYNIMAPKYKVGEVVMLNRNAEPLRYITITSVETMANSSYAYYGIYPEGGFSQRRFETVFVPERTIVAKMATADGHYVGRAEFEVEVAFHVARLRRAQTASAPATMNFGPEFEYSAEEAAGGGGGGGANYDADAAAMEQSLQEASATTHPIYSNDPENLSNGINNNGDPKPHMGGKRRQKRTRRRFKKSATRKRK